MSLVEPLNPVAGVHPGNRATVRFLIINIERPALTLERSQK